MQIPTPMTFSRSWPPLTAIWAGAPWVIGMRLWAMSMADCPPSPRDRREWQRMLDEKWAAFGLAWWAMSTQWWRMQLDAWSTPPAAAAWRDPARAWTGAWREGDRWIAAGLRPVARTVTQNRRRLARRSP